MANEFQEISYLAKWLEISGRRRNQAGRRWIGRRSNSPRVPAVVVHSVLGLALIFRIQFGCCWRWWNRAVHFRDAVRPQSTSRRRSWADLTRDKSVSLVHIDWDSFNSIQFTPPTTLLPSNLYTLHSGEKLTRWATTPNRRKDPLLFQVLLEKEDDRLDRKRPLRYPDWLYPLPLIKEKNSK